MRAVTNMLKAWKASESGAMAPIFALGIIAIMNVMILAIDYAHIIGSKSQIRHTMDASALAALRKAVDKIEVEKAHEVNRAELEAYAKQLVQTNLSANLINVDDVSLKYSYEKYVAQIEIQYQYTVDLFFGAADFTVRDTVRSEATVNPVGAWMDFQLLLDYSGSMSTGATKKDQVELIKLNNCAFACHQTNIDKAHAAGIELRQDKLLAALRVLVDTAEQAMKDKELHDDSSQFTIRRFNTSLRMEQAPTTDFRRVRNAINALPKVPSGSTNFSRALTETTAALPKSGRGTSAEDRRLFVFMVTDGVASVGERLHSGGSGRGTINPKDCEAIKAKGGVMAVVYTKYENYADSHQEAKGNDQRRGHFNHHVGRPYPHIENELQRCATDGFFFEASSPQDLNKAMQSFFVEAVKVTKGDLRLIY